MDFQPKISIILLNYNNKEYIFNCIESIKKSNYTNYEIIVVDNGSTDGSPERIEKELPDIKIIKLGKNLGFCKANNIGIENSTGEAYFILNNDTIVHPDLLKILSQELFSSSEIGIVGPKIYYMDEPKKVWFAGGVIDWKKAKTIDWKSAKTSVVGKDQMDNELNNDIKKEVDYITGCALMIKKEVVEKIGKMWEVFFIYYDDLEWSIRAKKAGYKVIYVPFGGVWHAKSVTVSRFYWDDLKLKLKKTKFYQKQFIAIQVFNRWLFQYMLGRRFRFYRNKFLFSMRHAPWKYKLKFLLIFLLKDTPELIWYIVFNIPKTLMKQRIK